jgi:hypothetical protein
MLTSDHKFRLLSFGEDSHDAADYARAERVYLDSMGVTARTDTNEIAYWKDRYNDEFSKEGDRLFIFGFLRDEEVIGFALVFYFLKHRMVVVDHIAIKEPARNFGSFFKFKEMIEDYMRKSLQIDYFIAEIVTSKEGDPHPVDHQLLIQLLKQQGFKVAHIPYYTPSIKEDEYTSRIDAALMIHRKDRGNAISTNQLLSLLDCLLNDLYLRWYKPHSKNIRAFRRQLKELRDIYKKEASKEPTVILNGNWAQPHVKASLSPKENLFTAVALVTYLTILAISLAGAAYYFKTGAMGMFELFTSVLFGLLVILAIWHKDASKQVDKVLKLISIIFRGHKKIS